MDEISIEKKKKPVWPWILLLVILALIGWAIYEYVSESNITSWAEPTTTGTMLQAQVQLHPDDVAIA